MKEKSQKEFDDLIESYYLSDTFKELRGIYIFDRKSGSIKLDTNQKNCSKRQLDKYKSKKYYLSSSDSN